MIVRSILSKFVCKNDFENDFEIIFKKNDFEIVLFEIVDFEIVLVGKGHDCCPGERAADEQILSHLQTLPWLPRQSLFRIAEKFSTLF